MCVAYAARGRHPFEAPTAAATAMRILSAEPALDGVPAELLPAVTTAMNRDPARRPDAVELVAVLTGQRSGGQREVSEATRRLLPGWRPPREAAPVGAPGGAAAVSDPGANAERLLASLRLAQLAFAGGAPAAAVESGESRPSERPAPEERASTASLPASGPPAGDATNPGTSPVAAPAGTRAAETGTRRRRRRRRPLLRLAFVVAVLLAGTAIASPLFDRGRDGTAPRGAAGPSLTPLPGNGATSGAGALGATPGTRSGTGPGGAPASAGPDGLAPGDTAAALGSAPPGVAVSASGTAAAVVAEPATTGRPVDAAAPAHTVVVDTGGGAVTVYLGPTTLGLFGGVRGSVPSGTPVDVYCGVYAQQVTGNGTASRLWVYTSSGWVPIGYVQAGSGAPSGVPACVGAVGNPRLGSGAPSPSTGPFPVTRTVTVLSLVGGVVGSLTNALLGADPVGKLLGGSLVIPRCQETDANNTVWDQLTSDGWIQHSYVYSGTSGSPAPAC